MDGAGYKITNLRPSLVGNGAGLFSATAAGVHPDVRVSNLTLEAPVVTGGIGTDGATPTWNSGGAFVGNGKNVTLTHCSVTGIPAIGATPAVQARINATFAGGMVGAVKGNFVCTDCNVSALTQVTNSGTADGHKSYVGGIIGQIGAQLNNSGATPGTSVEAVISASSSLAEITATSATAGSTAVSWPAGGLVGNFAGGSIRISESYSKGPPIRGESFVGGLVGSVKATGPVTIFKSAREGDVLSQTTRGGHVGGIAGSIYHQEFITNPNARFSVDRTYFAGSIVGREKVGGLIGFGRYGVVTRSASSGALSNYSFGGAGIVGYASTLEVNNCHTSIALSAGPAQGWKAGGFIGSADTGTRQSVINSLSTGKLLDHSGNQSISPITGTGLDQGGAPVSGGNYYDSTELTVTPPFSCDSSCVSMYWSTGVPKSTLQTSSASYAGWDFSSIWTMPAPPSYPRLQDLGPSSPIP
jgi:hypothetical protein